MIGDVNKTEADISRRNSRRSAGGGGGGGGGIGTDSGGERQELETLRIIFLLADLVFLF